VAGAIEKSVVRSAGAAAAAVAAGRQALGETTILTPKRFRIADLGAI
jgi:hypothetical protein